VGLSHSEEAAKPFKKFQLFCPFPWILKGSDDGVLGFFFNVGHRPEF
jgi:hypothetical protein